MGNYTNIRRAEALQNPHTALKTTGSEGASGKMDPVLWAGLLINKLDFVEWLWT
jgi:hypothetical protein